MKRAKSARLTRWGPAAAGVVTAGTTAALVFVLDAGGGWLPSVTGAVGAAMLASGQRATVRPRRTLRVIREAARRDRPFTLWIESWEGGQHAVVRIRYLGEPRNDAVIETDLPGVGPRFRVLPETPLGEVTFGLRRTAERYALSSHEVTDAAQAVIAWLRMAGVAHDSRLPTGVEG